MNTSDKIRDKQSNDPFDRLIFEQNLRIKKLIIEKEMDMMVVIFNNGKLLKIHLSDYPKLENASNELLQDYKITGLGVGIRWNKLDEDLSLKGFIKTTALNEALRNLQSKGGYEKTVS